MSSTLLTLAYLMPKKIDKLWPRGPFMTPSSDWGCQLITFEVLILGPSISSLHAQADIANKHHVRVKNYEKLSKLTMWL